MRKKNRNKKITGKKFLICMMSGLLCTAFCCSCGSKASTTKDANQATDSNVSTSSREAADSAASSDSSDLSLWNSEGAITEVTSYVEDVTDENGENFIPAEDRIAVFDLDGTLVGERFPIYFEWLMFAQRVVEDPELSSDEEISQVAKDVLQAAKTREIPDDLEARESEAFGKVFAGMTTEDYRAYVADFLSQETDSFDGLTYADAYFRPMTQIISYLEEHDFKVYVCSGTDRDADRVMLSEFTDIPNYQVIGSDYYTEGSEHDDTPYLDYQFDSDEEIVRDDTRIIKNVKSSKIVQMAQEIGQKPVLAFGNSSGDMSMFTYTTSDNEYKSAAFCILPDDDEREYANPEKAESLQDTCDENGWNTISMKNDFLTIYGDEVQKDPDNTSFVDTLLDKIS